jgi:hypothetical protein
MRVVARLLPIALIVLIVAAALVIFTRRPDLEDARKQVDSTWTAATPALDARYALLATATKAVHGTPGPVGQVANDVDARLQDWLEARTSKNRDQSIAVANDLDGVGRRFVLVVQHSPRLSANPDVMNAVNAFARSAEPAEVTRFSEAVQSYSDERQGPVGGVVAQMFGYGPVPNIASAPSA